MNRPRLGVSACLAGQRVRYDGGHKRHAALMRLAEHVELIEVCPEDELGLGVPRPPMHLEARRDGIELVISDSGEAVGERMGDYAQARVDELEELDGYVFKSKSPSCAVVSAPVVSGEDRACVIEGEGPALASQGEGRVLASHAEGRASAADIGDRGPGLFAERFLARWPTVPVVEEGGLTRHFVRRVFATCRLRWLFRPGWSTGDLVVFHTAHKLLLFCCDPGKTRELGAFVAASASLEPGEVAAGYGRAFAEILATPPSRGREIDTLQHCVGYFESATRLRERAADLCQGLIDDADADVRGARDRMTAMIADEGIDYLLGQHYFVIDEGERAALGAL